jgi:hypothetical protein
MAQILYSIVASMSYMMNLLTIEAPIVS